MATRALILAAGVGSRLMPLTQDRPKALVEVGGEPLLGRLLGACAAAGVREAVVVTGYRHQRVVDWLASARPALDVVTVFNPEYDSRGNAWSVGVARDALLGHDFVKLDGDLLLDPGLLEGLLSCPWPSALAVDRTAGLDEEAMKAQLDARGRVTALGKWLPVRESHGESIGVERIAANDAPALFAAIDELMTDGHADGYYEDAYHRMIGRGWELGAFEIGAARWAEIDDAADLARAQQLLVGA